jgi:uncharacterized membrane protein
VPLLPVTPGSNALLYGIISLVLAVIALILMQVNSNLKKLSDDKKASSARKPCPFYRNKIYIALIAVLLFVVGGYLMAKGSINLGRQQGYQPSQPIYYSIKYTLASTRSTACTAMARPGKASTRPFHRSTFA